MPDAGLNPLKTRKSFRQGKSMKVIYDEAGVLIL